MNAKRLAGRIGAGIVVFAALSQLIRPARTNPPTEPRQTLAAVERPPADVAAIIDRSCGDCHANRTTWPWYSNVAPISWWIVDHVNEGRRRVSFSGWAAYDPARRTKELDEICRRVERRNMPLGSYLLIHRDAQLSDEDRQAICNWTRAAAAASPPLR